MPFSLSVSIVVFDSDRQLLQRTIDALAMAIGHAATNASISEAHITLINNAFPQGAIVDEAFDPGAATRTHAPTATWRRIAGHGNVGFGRGHNLVICASDGVADIHLVLNPDAPLAVDALTIGLAWMRDTPDCGMVAPNGRSEDDAPLFLAKRYPDALTLLIRAAAPASIKPHFTRRLARYELRDIVGDGGERPARDVTLASGCCMLLRGEALRSTGGFDPSFFVYFEDYDLSLRLVRDGRWRIDYVPAMRLVHFGGHAARKSWAHVRMFAGGAIRFFSKHGWKFA